jgi:fructokinase
MRELLAVVDIFSPNLAEAESIVGPGTPRQVVERLLQLGAKLVVLRMGEQGVLMAQQAGTGGADGGEQGVEWHEVSA